jgi:hypothetical protein
MHRHTSHNRPQSYSHSIHHSPTKIKTSLEPFPSLPLPLPPLPPVATATMHLQPLLLISSLALTALAAPIDMSSKKTTGSDGITHSGQVAVKPSRAGTFPFHPPNNQVTASNSRASNMEQKPTSSGVAPLKLQKRQFDGLFDDKYVDAVFHHGLNSKPITLHDITNPL